MKKLEAGAFAIKPGDRVKSVLTGRLGQVCGRALEAFRGEDVYVEFDDGGKETCKWNWLEKA